MAVIKRVSLLSNIEHEMFIMGVSQQEADEWYYERRDRRLLVQDRWPSLTPSQREFLKTGITDAEFESLGEDADF